MLKGLFSIGMIFLATQNSIAQYLIAGTYTDNNSTSSGITVYRFDAKKGTLLLLSNATASNPSFQVISKDGKFVYSVNETATGNLSSFRFDKRKAQLHFLNTVDSKGAHPCHLALSPSGKWLIVSNYSSGDFAIYSIEKNGRIGALSDYVKHEGSGPDKSRQNAPHVHSATVASDGKQVYICDLGIDKIVMYPFDDATGKVSREASTSARTVPGAGPRHLSLSPDGRFAYNIDEMHGTVNGYSIKDGQLELLQSQDMLKAEKGKAAGADIHLSPDGGFLYVSQRSNSTIEVFKVNNNDGTIQFVQSHSTEGDFPRNFTIHPSGNWLLAANQRSDDITVFKIDRQTGMLRFTGKKYRLGRPVCLQWIP